MGIPLLFIDLKRNASMVPDLQRETSPSDTLPFVNRVFLLMQAGRGLLDLICLQKRET